VYIFFSTPQFKNILTGANMRLCKTDKFCEVKVDT